MSLIKNKYFLILLILLGGIFLFFKGKNIYQRYFKNFKKNANGLVYKFNYGEESQEGQFSSADMMLINYLMISPDGDTIINSFEADTATEVRYPSSNSNTLMAALRKMTSKSQMEVLVGTDSMKRQFINHRNLKNYDQLMSMPNGKYATFVIRVAEVLNPDKYEIYDNKKRIYRVTAEAEAVDGYCDTLVGEWLLEPDRHFRSHINTSTNNERPKSGDEIAFEVLVTKFNGATHMNTRQERKKYKTVLGQTNHPLRALQILPLYMNFGEDVTFVVPSYLAYDANGSYGIAPYEPLIIQISELEKL